MAVSHCRERPSSSGGRWSHDKFRGPPPTKPRPPQPRNRDRLQDNDNKKASKLQVSLQPLLPLLLHAVIFFGLSWTDIGRCLHHMLVAAGRHRTAAGLNRRRQCLTLHSTWQPARCARHIQLHLVGRSFFSPSGCTRQSKRSDS